MSQETAYASKDCDVDANNLTVAGTATVTGQVTIAAGISGVEQGADQAAPAANGFKLYAKDNGSGKTLLVVRFATGAVQTIATEP